MEGVGRRWKREKARLEGGGEGEDKRGGKAVEARMDAMAGDLAASHAMFPKEVGWLLLTGSAIRICFSDISDHLLSLVRGQPWALTYVIIQSVHQNHC